MKRSFINTTISKTINYLNEQNFYLPKWAYWTLEEWKKHKNTCGNIFDAKLGWDVSDSGGDFKTNGLVLFTIRNGNINTNIRPYCEKIIVMEQYQKAPYHFHKTKTEDIINRSQTELCFRLGNAEEDGSFSDEDVDVLIDGIAYTVETKKEIILKAGESITLFPYCYHAFYPKNGIALIGEVSKVNNDYTDNFFLEDVRRFPLVDEDEDILYPIINDYEAL